MHFVGALIISAAMTTRWRSVSSAAIALMLCGIAGLAYSGRVVVRARQQTAYEPVWEDWLWHVVLPCLAYTTLGIAALLARRGAQDAVFAVAACALTPLLIGIHNGGTR